MTDFIVTSPLVSVVIPAYKARNYLRESLASVAAQDYPNLEVWVIDDKSPEPIDDILAEYREDRSSPPLQLIRHETNQGLGASRNTGIREAQGEYVAFLDHDDLWAPDHLSRMLETAMISRADIAYCSVKQFSKAPNDEMEIWGPDQEDLGTSFPMALFTKSFITPSATLVRRQLLLDLGGFNTAPSVHMCEDLDLWLRMLDSNLRFAHSDRITCYYRKHAEAATGRSAYMAYQSAHVREIHIWSVSGSFLKKCSLVAKKWWDAFRILPNNDPRAKHALLHALLWSIPVPWETARGILHLCGIRIRRETAPRAADGV
jgi:glycosyltransferase involved in cell wall biosynthesis